MKALHTAERSSICVTSQAACCANFTMQKIIVSEFFVIKLKLSCVLECTYLYYIMLSCLKILIIYC